MIHKQKRMKNKLRTILLSRKTALVGIAIIAFLSGISFVFPQQTACTPDYLMQWQKDHRALASIADALLLHSIFSSTIFLTCVGALFFSMCLSTYTVWKNQRSLTVNNSLLIKKKSLEFFEFIVEQKKGIKDILESFQRHGYSLKTQLPNDKFYTVKNEMSKWGTVLLHGGMLVIVAASLFHFVSDRRGFVQIIEGDTFFGAKDEFLVHEEGPLAKSFHPNLAIGLDKVAPRYYSNAEIQSLESGLKIADSNEDIVSKSVSVNHSIEVEGVTVYQTMSNGYTVGLILEKHGQKIPTYFSLDRPRKFSEPFAGISDFPTTDYSVSMRLFPNENKKSFELKNPKLLLSILKNGTSIFNDTLSLYEKIDFAGNRLTFSDIRQWSGFIVTESFGVSFIFAGFGMSLLGLFFIYFLPVKEIVFTIEQNDEHLKVFFYGYSRREKALFAEEFMEIMEEQYLNYGVVNVGNELVGN